MKIRELLWNYPEILAKIVRLFAPISYIALTLLVLFLSGTFVLSKSDFRSMLIRKDRTIIREGVVGHLTNLNPIYIPQGQVDRDLQMLTFRKLVKISPKGEPLPDLAVKWSVSTDSKKYTFSLDPEARWHDGVSVTSDDVVFTFETARELATKLSQETIGQGFEGVKVKKVSDREFTITISQSSATFWETISIYIIPAHILREVSLSQFAENVFSKAPVGNGIYEIVSSGDSGVILKKSAYTQSSAVENYEYYMYNNVKDLEVAFRNNRLDIVSGVSLRDMDYVNEYRENYDILQFVVNTRKKAIFLNSRMKAFGNSSMRRAISYLLDKEKLISEADIDGQAVYSSFSVKSWAYDRSLKYPKYNPKLGAQELALAGYKKEAKSGFFQSTDGKILTFTLTYLDNKSNEVITKQIKKQFGDEGIILNLDPQSFDRLTKETLATRDYQMLLYEIETSIDPDQYDLWHSLRVDYPYLNLSGYTNERVDIFLEKGRTQIKRTERVNSYNIVQRLLNEDIPAIMIYEPQFNFVVSDRIKNVDLGGINFPEERYNTLSKWEL